MTYRRAVDASQKEIAETFRRFGFSVFFTHRLGHGWPDLAVSYQGRTYLVECKTGTRPSDRKLTPAERLFHDNWQGIVAIISTAEEAESFAQAWRLGL